jgi:hypothetical protein
MTSRSDLHDAYAHLSETAPDRAALDLPPHPSGQQARQPRTKQLRIALAVLTVIVLALASPFAVRYLTHGDAARPADPSQTVTTPAPSPTPASFPTSYYFGPTSLPGYVMDTETLTATSQDFGFTSQKTHVDVALRALPATSANNAIYRRGAPVTVAGRAGFFVVVAGKPTTTPTVAWKISSRQWATLSAVKSRSQVTLTKAQLLDLADHVTLAQDGRAALVKVGYLPAGMRFDQAAVYRNQGVMAAPDLLVGTGYRDESFVSRQALRGQPARMEIVSVYQPFHPLATATPKTLPAFDNGPWTKTRVHGHLAWTAPHDVIIQWGPIIIDLVSNRPTGNTTTPLISRAELLKVAAALTAPTSNAVGDGFPLDSSLPPGTIE